MQLPLRRLPPEDRGLLRELPPRGLRLGREVLRRRERRDHRHERQLPEHAGRDLRDSLPAAHDRVLADPGLGRRRPDARRSRVRGGSCASRGPRSRATRLFDRTKPGFGAWALDGGGKGGRGAIMVKRRGDAEFRTFSEAFGTVSPSKFTNIRLEPGDEVLIDSPGGGGYGDPRERDRDRLERDVVEGFVSAGEGPGARTAGTARDRPLGADPGAGLGDRRDALRLLRPGRRQAALGRRGRGRRASFLRPGLRGALPPLRPSQTDMTGGQTPGHGQTSPRARRVASRRARAPPRWRWRPARRSYA